MPQSKPLPHVGLGKGTGLALQCLAIVAVPLMGAPVLAQNASAERVDLSQDIPEEVLQAEMILQGRSPIDGSALTPAEYAQLQDQLQVARGDVPGRLAPKIHRTLFLLRVRKVIITLFPFIDL